MAKRAAKKGAQPANQNARASGFYSDQFTDQELALVAAFISDPTLDDELWMQRVLNRRLLIYSAKQDLPTEALIGLATTLAIGTGRVARLLRDKRALSGEAANGLAEAIAAALDEISSEIGEKL